MNVSVMQRALFVSILMLALVGCAAPARIDQMTAVPSAQLPTTSPLYQSVSVNNISGGSSTNPMLKSNVGNLEFQSALQNSLRAAGMLANSSGRYRLDAMINKLDQPLIGFDMSVTSTVNYTLTDTTNSNKAFDQTINETYTATVSDALAGVERLQLANEGSIKKHIGSFLDRLRSHFSKPPVVSQINAATPSLGG